MRKGDFMQNESSVPEEKIWSKAHAIAKSLTKQQQEIARGKDGIRTELKKVNSYFRHVVIQTSVDTNTIPVFFEYLDTLVKNGKSIGHTGNTPKYYECIREVCKQHLKDLPSDALAILQILGWAIRLIHYYSVTPIGETVEIEFQEPEVIAVTERQAAIEELKSTQAFEEGQIIEAQVEKKQPKGSRVTYLIGRVSFPEKEPKTFNQIPESGTVKVQIKSLKEDGSINHIKFFEP